MTRLPLEPRALCKTGRSLFSAVQEALDPGRPTAQAVNLWDRFRSHAPFCETCYRPTSLAGGPARIWASIAPPATAEPEE